MPLWAEPDGNVRPPHANEVRADLPVVGWCNVLVAELDGQPRRLLLARQVPA